MKHEDLIEKLENLKTPEIELRGHKQVLKMVLLNSGHFRQRTIMDWAKILAPISAAVLLIAVVGFFNVIQPRLQMAQAKELAMNDPQVQELMGEYGLEITEVKLQNGEAFVLLTSGQSRPDEDVVPAFGEGAPSACNITVSGYILKVDLAEEKVTDFGKVDEIKGLRYMNLEDVDFTKLALPEGDEPEEEDLD